MTHFNATDYWLKAQVFANRATDRDDARSEEERRLWATLALEALAKWALARVSPTLVADPLTGDGVQLLKALGLAHSEIHVSVTASTAFKRCQAIYKAFDAKKAQQFASARNEYLHGTNVAVMALPNDPWWSGLWSLVNILLAAQGSHLDELLGPTRAHAARRYLGLNKRLVADQFEAAKEFAVSSLGRYDGSLMSSLEAARWEAWRGGAGMLHTDVAKCPACGEVGKVESDWAEDGDILWPQSDWPVEPVLMKSWIPEFFSCGTCHLVLDTYELIVEAGLDDERSFASDDPIYLDPEYGND